MDAVIRAEVYNAIDFDQIPRRGIRRSQIGRQEHSTFK
jgi:hypothetical protein